MSSNHNPEKPVNVTRVELTAEKRAPFDAEIQRLYDSPFTKDEEPEIERQVQLVREQRTAVGEHFIASSAAIGLRHSVVNLGSTSSPEGETYIHSGAYNALWTEVEVLQKLSGRQNEIDLFGIAVEPVKISSRPLAHAIANAANEILVGQLTPKEAHLLESAKNKLMIEAKKHTADKDGFIELSDIALKPILKAFAAAEKEGKRHK